MGGGTARAPSGSPLTVSSLNAWLTLSRPRHRYQNG